MTSHDENHDENHDELRDQMHHEVAGVRADPVELARVAATRGRVRVHRRHQARAAGALLGAAAAVTLALGGTSWLAGSTRPGAAPPASAPTASVTRNPTASQPVPVTPRAVVAALLEVVPDLQGLQDARVVPGSLGGGSADTPGEQAFGRATFETPDGRVVVGVEVQRLSTAGGGTGRCERLGAECDTRTLPGGDQLTTYRLDETDDTQMAADLVSTRRDLRVTVNANSPTGEAEPLGPDRVGALVAWSGWAWQFPASFADEVADVPPFDVPD